MANNINQVGLGSGVASYERQTSNFPQHVPLYGKEEGLKWEKPVSKRIERDGQLYDIVFSQSSRGKLHYDKVLKFYENQFKKLGWEIGYVAGGSTYYDARFMKNNEECNIRYTRYSKGDDPDQPVDPKGAKIMMWYEKRVK